MRLYQPCISVEPGGLGRSRGARIRRCVHSAAVLLLPASPAVLKPNQEGKKSKIDQLLVYACGAALMNGEVQRPTTCAMRKREQYG